MRTTTALLVLLVAGALGGCATVSPAERHATQQREAQCARMCADVFTEMTLSKDDGHGTCRCWAMGDSERVSPAAIAAIHYPTNTYYAGR